MDQSDSEYASPEFETYVISHTDGSPDTVSITPICRGGSIYNEENVFSTVASSIQSSVIEAIKAFNPNFSDSSLGKVNGILQMNNINDYRKAHTTDLNLGEFGIADVQEIFERVVEYGEISIFDVEFSFWINPLSLKAGNRLGFNE
jgi:hypothetical protein